MTIQKSISESFHMITTFCNAMYEITIESLLHPGMIESEYHYQITPSSGYITNNFTIH